jgi:hypothetical protein
MTATSNITVTGRVDPDSYIDFALLIKAKGWATKGEGYKATNGSLSLVVVATRDDGFNESDMINEIRSALPKLDGAIISETELNELCNFDIEAEDAEPEKWW